MKKLINAVDDVVREQLEGLALAYPDLLTVSLDPKTIVRTDAPVADKVAVISGGGSGHEPMHKDLGALFKLAGMTLMSSVGGASGMLYGNFFLRAAVSVGGKDALSPIELVQVLESGRDGVVQRGRAELGDKTMIDVWTPALAALEASVAAGEALPIALDACVTAAEQGMAATSSYIILCALRDTLS